jgi:hypothetical protein
MWWVGDIHLVDTRNLALDRPGRLVERAAADFFEDLSRVWMVHRCESRASNDSELRSTTKREDQRGSRTWSPLQCGDFI